MERIIFLRNWIEDKLGRPPIPEEEIKRQATDHWELAIELIKENKAFLFKNKHIPPAIRLLDQLSAIP